MPLATFPSLQTGAVIQYPARRSLTFSTQTTTFVDGATQRFRNYSAGIVRWVIQLQQLTPGEISALQNFYLDQQGSFGSFRFVDPADAAEYNDCSFEQDNFDFELLDETRGRLTLMIRSNGAQS